MLILNQTQAKELSGSYQNGVKIRLEWGNIFAETFWDGSILIYDTEKFLCNNSDEVYPSLDEFRNTYAFYL